VQRFTKTTSRTVAWIKRASDNEQLILAPPYQRNPVWTEKQQSSLIETILLEYPIPELYMQDVVNDSGGEQHIVVDGQQRVRAVLDFLEGKYDLSEEGSRWDSMSFEDLSSEDKKRIFEYDFVVRLLPEMADDQIRSIFQRINRTNVTLNSQELRHATYWGPFIKLMEELSDLEFWEESGVFSANDRRRMLDTEYISEIAIAFLNGPQNKKSKLEDYYRLYEIEFSETSRVKNLFFTVLGEILAVLPDIAKTRWKKKSDFYTLFLCLADHHRVLPLSLNGRHWLRDTLRAFGSEVDYVLSGDDEFLDKPSSHANSYAENVARAASDVGSRRQRKSSLSTIPSPIFEAEEHERAQANKPSDADATHDGK